MGNLTILNRYRLTGSDADFCAAIEALAARVEQEGHSGVLSYRFFLNRGEATCQAAIEYSGPEGWLGHHDISMGWPEMKAMHNVAVLEDVTFLGPFTDEIRQWLAGSALTATVRTGFEKVAGFSR